MKKAFIPQSVSESSTKYKSLNINSFLGVNYDKSELNIGDAQASEIKNLIFRDGVIQKRRGYEQIAEFDDTIYGYYRFIGGETKTEYHIFHIGNGLYFTPSLEEKIVLNAIASLDGNAFVLAEHKSYGFTGENKLFILDGTTFWVLEELGLNQLDLDRVDSSNSTYIPTTSIGITEQESAMGITALDDVNLMTKWRKNTLRTGTSTKEAYERSSQLHLYELDTNIIPQTSSDIFQIQVVVNRQIEGTETNVVNKLVVNGSEEVYLE